LDFQTSTETTDYAAAARIHVQGSCGHLFWCWVNDRDQKVVDAILDQVCGAPCPRASCTTGGAFVPVPHPEVRHFTR
jgi:hypothetical protein